MKEKSPFAPPAQNWRFEPKSEPGTAAISGEIDFSVTPKVRECLLAFIDETAGEIRLDLSGLSYIDSSGLALLIEARKILQESGRGIRIIGISKQVQKLFNLTQLGELFGLEP